MSSRSTSNLVRSIAALGVSAVVAGGLAACGSAKPTPSPSPSPSHTASQPAPAPAPQAVSPLTGLPSSTNQTIMAVKMPNTAEANPQVGLGNAEMVVEELVEGGISRFMAYFQSNAPGTVGPVRSARETDIGMVLPLHAVIVASGEAPETWDSVIQAGAQLLDGGPGFFRAPGRVAPYNEMAALQDIGQRLGQTPGVAPLLPYVQPGTAAAPPAASSPASAIDARFSAGRTSSFGFLNGKYVMLNGFAPPSDQFAADTLVAIRVNQTTAGYRDPAGNPVPVSVTTGSGPVVVFHNGTATGGTWTKSAPTAPYTFTSASGTPLALTPGKVWLELVPVDGAGGSLSFH